MTKVTLAGWREGRNKVQLNHLLRQQAGFTLGQAKRAVDRLLAGKSVSFELPDTDSATAFCHSARTIGADCFVAAAVDEDAGTPSLRPC